MIASEEPAGRKAADCVSFLNNILAGSPAMPTVTRRKAVRFVFRQAFKIKVGLAMDQARQSRDAICDPTMPGDPRTQTRQLRLADEIGATPLIHNPVLNRGATQVRSPTKNPSPFPSNYGG